MTDRPITEEEFIRGMVEDYWRCTLSVAKQSPELSLRMVQRFDMLVQLLTKLLPDDQSKKFQTSIECERQAMMKEYDNNSDAMKRRLGLTVNAELQAVPYFRQGLSETVANTAVRATVWQVVSSLFRR